MPRRDPAFVLEEVLRKLNETGLESVQVTNADTTYYRASTKNSTTTPLDAAETYEGEAEEVLEFSTMTVIVDTDQDGTLRLELSQDGTNWDRVKPVPVKISVGSGSAHSLEMVSRFFRVVFVNGATDQGHLRLQTIYHRYRSVFLTSSPNQQLSKADDVQLVRTINDPFTDISRSLFADKQAVHIIGANVSSPNGTRRDIWEYGATTVVGGNINYPWPMVADTVVLVSDSTDDDASPDTNIGCQSVVIVGLDNNFDQIFEVRDLNGTTPVTSVNSYRRVHKVFAAAVGTYTGNNVGNITCTHTISGDVLAYIPAGLGETQMSMYTIPNNFTGYIRHAHGSVSAGANKDATVRGWKRLNADDITLPFRGLVTDNVGGAARIFHTWENLQGANELDFYSLIPFLQKTDIWWTALGTAVTSVSVTYDLIIIEGDVPTSPQ